MGLGGLIGEGGIERCLGVYLPCMNANMENNEEKCLYGLLIVK